MAFKPLPVQLVEPAWSNIAFVVPRQVQDDVVLVRDFLFRLLVPFEELKLPMEDEDDAEAGFSPGDEVTLIGLLDWGTDAVQTVDDDGKVAPSGFYKLDW